MAKSIRIHELGGPQVLIYEDSILPPLGQDDVLIKNHAIGLNFIDTYFRTGLYPAPSLPFTPGSESAGEVLAFGANVTDFKIGDRVATVATMGAYADERIVAAANLVKLPDGISYRQAAGIMLKGLTAEYLLHRTYKVQQGDTVLIHAAAGATGQILVQWARHLGATVIATVGSDAKARIAKDCGAHHVINYATSDFANQVKEITEGKLCDVVYDGVGKTTFMGSLDCLKPFGYMVSFGSASGAVEGVNIGVLASKGSLYLTRPTLGTHVAKRQTLVDMAARLFDAVSKGIIKVDIGLELPLKEAAKAHIALESRQTTGATILVP